MFTTEDKVTEFTYSFNSLDSTETPQGRILRFRKLLAFLWNWVINDGLETDITIKMKR